MYGKLLLTLVILITIFSAANAQKIQRITYNELPKGADSLEIHEGILIQHAMKIKYKRNGRKVATIELSEPVMIAMADQEEKWGYFQFPSIGKGEDGSFRVSWQMKDDSHLTYGKESNRVYKPMVSYNEGKTWHQQNENYKIKGYSILMSDGSYLQVLTPESKNINNYKNFPKRVGKRGQYTYYKVNLLPDELRGVYLNYVDANGKLERIHATLNDPGLLRYAIGDQMPLLWWGNIKELSDGTLVAGVYPTNYLDEQGNPTLSGVSFYQSKDCGKNWDVLSRITYNTDGVTEYRGDRRFDEPSFEILPDSTFICVMRTGSASPMCKSFSYDKGRTWTKPEPFTPNGVAPSCLMLKNGVLVLTSGRPGVQVRFSLDGGRNWTDAIDMIPFSQGDEAFELSCGYVSIIEKDDCTFFMTYSDFTKKNGNGENRKSIWVRKVSIQR